MPDPQPGLRDIQRGLTLLNFQPGPIDGRFGARTETALLGLLQARGPALEQPKDIMPNTGPMIRQGMAGHIVRGMVVHCSATQAGWMADHPLADKVAEIRLWHTRDRGWRDIGYHWVIDREGAVAPGRRETEIGAHVEGLNAGTLGICLDGGFGTAATDAFERHFTPAQEAALRAQIEEIRGRTPITRVSGHNEWAPKACPGFSVPRWITRA